MLQKGEQANSRISPLGRWLVLQITLKAKKTRTMWDILSLGPLVEMHTKLATEKTNLECRSKVFEI